MSDIGRQVGKQKSNIIVNANAFNAMSHTVNILRKTHYDDSQFSTSQDQGGNYVTVKQDALLKDLTINNIPFMISNNEQYIPSADNKREFKVQNGCWYITDYNYLSACINVDKSDDESTIAFTDRGDGYFVSNVTDTAAQSSVYIYVTLERDDYVREVQFPTQVVLHCKTQQLPLTSGDIRYIGHVENTDGVLQWEQHYWGDIYSDADNFVVESIYDTYQDVISANSPFKLDIGTSENRYVQMYDKTIKWKNYAYGTYRVTARVQCHFMIDDANIPPAWLTKFSYCELYFTTGTSVQVLPSDKETIWYMASVAPTVVTGSLTAGGYDGSGDLYFQMYLEHIMTLPEVNGDPVYNSQAIYHTNDSDKTPRMQLWLSNNWNQANTLGTVRAETVQVTVEKICYRNKDQDF